MDPYGMMPGVPPMPKPKKPPKPDPATRRMKALDYVGLLLGIDEPPPDAPLPPPIGYRFPEEPDPQFAPPHLPAPLPVGPVMNPPRNPLYAQHVLKMRGRMGF